MRKPKECVYSFSPLRILSPPRTVSLLAKLLFSGKTIQNILLLWAEDTSACGKGFGDSADLHRSLTLSRCVDHTGTWRETCPGSEMPRGERRHSGFSNTKVKPRGTHIPTEHPMPISTAPASSKDFWGETLQNRNAISTYIPVMPVFSSNSTLPACSQHCFQ